MLKPVLERLKDRLKEHGETYKIDELCLDEIPLQQLSPQYSKAIQKCVNVEYITFQSCKLTQLTILPRLPKLRSLELDNNMLLDQSIKQISNYPSLKQLTIKNNKINNIQSFNPLISCKGLTLLQIQGNPVCEIPEYRATLFSKLPQLQIIDQYNKQGSKIVFKEEEEEESQMSDSESGEEESEERERDSPTKFRKPN